MKKIVVYTAIFGAYDSQLVETQYDHEKFDFVCFTDQKRLKSDTWDIRYISTPPVPNDNPRSSYYYKTNPHVVWGLDYDISVWMDASCNKLDITNLEKMIEEFKTLGTSLYIEKHPGRTCIYAELEANCRLKKDDEDAMRKHVEGYRAEGMPEQFGMVETGLQIRKHNEVTVIEFQDALWQEIKNKTRRDQLSWTYVQWKQKFTDFSRFTFQEKTEVLWFQDHPHREKHIEKVLVVGPWYGEEQYEKFWIEEVEAYLGRTPIDTVIVGCREGKESLYESISPDRFVTAKPEGTPSKNLLNGAVPKFNVKSTGEKQIIQFNPTTQIFNRMKQHDGDVHFKIDICGWKSEKYIDKCIQSLLSQKHKNWEAFIVLDPDDEGNKTYEIAKKYESDKIHVYLNDKREGSLHNHRKGMSLANPHDEDVLAALDSEDWYAHDSVLTMIQNAYLKNPDNLVTHGSWIDYPNPGELQPNNSHPYRKEEFADIRHAFFRATMVRTMKAKIWKAIKEEDLQDVNGKYYETAGDVALMIPALEMAGYDRVTHIPEVIYIYNRETELNDDKIRTTQGLHHIDIIKKKPYSLFGE
tara:strand:+ start:23230 stop:24972 length:1743 start_codon:yes stop_codon:yes gene_type:complete